MLVPRELGDLIVLSVVQSLLEGVLYLFTRCSAVNMFCIAPYSSFVKVHGFLAAILAQAILAQAILAQGIWSRCVGVCVPIVVPAIFRCCLIVLWY